MNRVYLGVGSNVEPALHCKKAIEELTSMASRIRCSTAYQSEAVGFDGPSFINLVVELDTDLSLQQLALYCRELEFRLGRSEQAQKNQNRTIDIDILLFNNTISESPLLPRPDLRRFVFVLLPMVELASELIVPGTTNTIAQLWEQHQSTLLLQQPITPINLDL